MKISKLYGVNPVEVQDWSALFAGRGQPEIQIESKRAVGIEVEVENAVTRQRLYSGVWHNHADGSLRNNGTEYVSSPIPASLAPPALKELLVDSLNQDECCFSPRTSIHVHVDFTRDEDAAVQRAVLLYTLFEKLFFRFTGRGRIKNIYCVPLIDTNMLQYFSTTDTRTAQGSWSKYSALNILPLQQYGTIEFRHMHGTFDLNKVSLWIRMITKLCDYAVTCGSLTDWFQKLGKEEDYQQLLVKIFGIDADWLKYQGYDDVEQSIGKILTSYTTNTVIRELLVARDTKAPFYMAGK